MQNRLHIGYIEDKCSLCKTDSESLDHIFFECRPDTKQFCKEFENYFYTLTREFVSDLTRRYYRNIIYKLPFTELFDSDR